MRRVLVTRPEQGARRTGAKLESLGFEPVLLPLTEVLPLPVSAVLPDAAAVAVTSANALRHAPPALIATLAHLPCHAVGARTAQAARDSGFVTVHEGPGDAVELAGQLAGLYAGRAIVYLCGRVRFPAFEERLESSGVRVLTVETYDTKATEHGSADIAARLSGRPVEWVLLYSAKAAEAFAATAARPELAHLFADAILLCLSGRVAAALTAFDGREICVSPEPNEEALLGLLPG